MNFKHPQSLFAQRQLTTGFVALGQAIQSFAQWREEGNAFLTRIGILRQHQSDLHALLLNYQLNADRNVESHMLEQHIGISLGLEPWQQVLKRQPVGRVKGTHRICEQSVQHPVFIVGNETWHKKTLNKTKMTRSGP